MSDPNAPSPAEQLARLWHEDGCRIGKIHFPEVYGEQGTSERLPWDDLSERTKNYLVAIAEEIITVLLEGRIIEYPDPGDKLAMLLGKTEDGKIRVDFQKPLKWFAFDRDHAVNFAITILHHCGVPVNITLNPPPASSENPV